MHKHIITDLKRPIDLASPEFKIKLKAVYNSLVNRVRECSPSVKSTLPPTKKKQMAATLNGKEWLLNGLPENILSRQFNW
jgi:hypothetical protein